MPSTYVQPNGPQRTPRIIIVDHAAGSWFAFTSRHDRFGADSEGQAASPSIIPATDLWVASRQGEASGFPPRSQSWLTKHMLRLWSTCVKRMMSRDGQQFFTQVSGKTLPWGLSFCLGASRSRSAQCQAQLCRCLIQRSQSQDRPVRKPWLLPTSKTIHEYLRPYRSHTYIYIYIIHKKKTSGSFDMQIALTNACPHASRAKQAWLGAFRMLALNGCSLHPASCSIPRTPIFTCMPTRFGGQEAKSKLCLRQSHIVHITQGLGQTVDHKAPTTVEVFLSKTRSHIRPPRPKPPQTTGEAVSCRSHSSATAGRQAAARQQRPMAVAAVAGAPGSLKHVAVVPFRLVGEFTTHVRTYVSGD